MTQKDAHFVSTWRGQTGQLTPEEQAGRSIADWKQLQGALPAVATVGKLNRGEAIGETRREDSSPHSTVMVVYQEQVRQGPGGEDSQVAVGRTSTRI